jgi:hypothetical protein
MHGYGLGVLSRRRRHLMISLGQCDVKMPLQLQLATSQVAPMRSY